MNVDRTPTRPKTAPAGSAACVCILDLDGIIRWIGGNDPGLVIREEEGTIGSTFCDLWRDPAAVNAAIGNAAQVGQSGLDCVALHSGIPFRVLLQLRRDADGRSEELIASIAKVHEIWSQESYQSLFDAIPVVLWTSHDPDAALIVGNPQSELRYGIPFGGNHSLSQPKETVHSVYRYYLDGREVGGSRLPMQRAAKGEHVRNEEYEVRFHDGRVDHVILSASPLRDAGGKITGSVGVEIDITERKRIEAAQARLIACSRATGPAFFAELVRAIAETLGARQVYIAEIVGDDPRTLHTLAAYIDGKPAQFEDFDPIHTPCADVVKGELTFIPNGVRDRYPNSEILRGLNGESYIGAPLRASNGDILGIIGVVHDRPMPEALRPVETVEIFAGRAAAEIQRMHIEASLRRSEQDSRIITDAMPALIAFVDRRQRYQFANAAYQRWFDLKPAELMGRKVQDVLGADAYATIKHYVERALSGEAISFESFIPYEIGSRHVQVKYVPHLQNGNVIGYFSFVNDIGHLKEQEEALRKSEEQFRTLFEHLPVGAALIERSGAVVLENEVFGRLIPSAKRQPSPSIFSRACTAHLEDGTLLPDTLHPVRRALQGHVARGVEFLCRYAEGPRQTWVRMSGVPIRDENGDVTGALVVVVDIHSEKRADERRTLLINELNHRVKNTLASVQSIASQTFRTSRYTDDGLDAFESRLLALSNAHNLLTRENWEGADLQQLARLVMEPHDPGSGRLQISGPFVRMRPAQALAFAMALHELATNAVKYGALSNSTGTVTLSWHVAGPHDARRLQLSWVERGGPPVYEPKRKGFGSRLIERSLSFELGSDTSIEFRREGVVCRIDADLAEIGG